MDAVCEECGDVGITDLLLHCSNCMTASRHRYCFPTVIFEPVVHWMCSYCLPKHCEANKSFEDMSNQRLPRNIQVGSSISNEVWSWGSRGNSSNSSLGKDHLVCNEGSQDDNEGSQEETSRGPADPLLSTEDKSQRRMNVESYYVGDDPRESGKSWRANETSSLKLAEGDQNGSNLKCNVAKTSSSDGKKLPSGHVLQVKSISNESLSSKFVSPCESTKVNPRKRHQSASHTTHKTKYQKTKLIKKNESAYDARSKSGRPAASMEGNQSMSRKKTSSNDKVIDNSKLGRHKKRDKSWLLRSRCAKQVTKVDQTESSRQSDHTNSGAFLKISSKTEVHAANVVEPKKRRRLQFLDAECGKSDASVLPLQTVAMEEYCALSKRPVISEDISVHPIGKPYWTGIMKVGRDYIPLAAHLSNKASKKVQELSRELPPIMKVKELSTLQALPKSLEAPTPIVDSVVMYFFSVDTRPNKELDRLVKHVDDNGIVLETVVGLAKLFLFPSIVLPEEYQTYQGKHYLWGVFEHRDDKRRKLAPAKKDCMAHVMEQEQLQEQHVFGKQDKAQHVTLYQEMPLAKHVESQSLLDTNRDIRTEALSDNDAPSIDVTALVTTNISPADCGQPCSNSEAQPLEMCGFIVSRTPRSVQLIQETQKEGAIVFAMQPTLKEHVPIV